MDTFDFQEALSYIKCGETVELELNGVRRRYHLSDNGGIMCVPQFKEHLEYLVKDFKIDAVMSNNWTLVRDETNSN